MHAYTKLVKKFLNGYMAETREQRGMSKEEMSERCASSHVPMRIWKRSATACPHRL